MEKVGAGSFVGRSDELAVLGDRLGRACKGAGSVVLLSGEAGVGKSRLVAELQAWARQVGTLTVQGACFELDRTLPYAPIADLLRWSIAGRTDKEMTELFGEAAPELLKLLPELAAWLPSGSLPAALDPDQDRARFKHTVVRFLSGLAADQPLLVVFEDLHWCDDGSLELLHTLARRVAMHPILVILTFRSDEVHGSLAHFLAELERGRLAVEVTVGRLTMPDVDAKLRDIFGQSEPIRRDFLEAVFDLTDGNPFFVEEVVKALIASGDIFRSERGWDRRPLSELRIPRTIHDAVQRRVRRLTTEARRLLVIAAVAGERFDFSLLLHLMDTDESSVLELVKELVGEQLVVEHSTDHFQFRHALTRQAVLAELLGRERRRLHSEIANALARQFEGAPERIVAELAQHCFAAGDWANAFEYGRRAGAHAARLYAPRAAVEHFTHALQAASELSSPTQFDVLRGRAQAFETLGRFDDARQDYEFALASSRQSGEARPEWQALLDLGNLWAARDYARAGEYLREALDLARALGDSDALARSLNRVGNWHLNDGKPDEALRLHEAALALFETANDRRGSAETLDLMGMAASHSGDVVGGIDRYLQAAALFRELDDRAGLSSVLSSIGELGMDWPILVEATPGPARVPRSYTEEAVALARGAGWRSGEAYALTCLSFRYANEGQYGTALAAARNALDIAGEIEHQQWMAAAHQTLGYAYLDLLALPLAHQQLTESLTLARETGSAWWIVSSGLLLAWAHVYSGRLDTAEQVLDSTLSSGTFSLVLLSRAASRLRAELALRRGDGVAALSGADELLASTVNRPQELMVPGLSLLRGQALLALQRPDEAESELCAVRQFVAQRGGKPFLWRIHAALAHCYRLQGRAGDADVAAQAAREVIDELAATAPDEAPAELGGASIRNTFIRAAQSFLPATQPSTPLQAAKQAYGGLTAREREIAVLIARGKANREIASFFVLSERTVEYHVSNILAKLGAASRTQIAAWATERGLVSGTSR